MELQARGSEYILHEWNIIKIVIKTKILINKLGGKIDKMDQNTEDKNSIRKYKIKNY